MPIEPIKFAFFDLSIFILYFLGIVALGVWLARREKRTARDYFLAGDRLPWYAIGGSVLASEQIRQAQDILGGRLASVQNQFSPAFRSSEPELRLADELGIAFLPWSPLGGISSAADLGDRFAPFAEVAQARGISPQVVALAWHLAQSPHVIPIPGSSRPETIRDSVSAVDVELTPDELSRLNAA